MSDIIKPSPKSFLARPEGKVAAIATCGAAALALYGLYFTLPFLITLATNVIHLGALCAVIGVVAYLILDPKLRAFLSYVYRAFFRMLTGFFIELDPIGILESHILTLQGRLGHMREQMGNLNGQIRHIERVITENSEAREQAMRLAHVGKNQPDYANASRLQARNAIKLEESNQNLSSMQQQMQTLARMLKKLYDTAELVLGDMQSTVSIKKRERESMKAAYSAYKSAFAILRGQSEGSDLYDRAMEFLNADYARKLGEIEMFMDFSDGIIKATDLQNMAYDDRAMSRLEEWERRLDQTMLGEQTPKAQLRVPDSLDALLDAPRTRAALPSARTK